MKSFYCLSYNTASMTSYSKIQCFYSFREEAPEKDTQVYWKTDNNTVYQVDGSKSFNLGEFIIASKVNLVSFFFYENKSLMNNTGFVTKDQTKRSINCFNGNFEKSFIHHL